ncbi:AsmA-like C-terminal region-containing protein [Asticcacaulis sp. AC402]|uniref:YhdP family protein n=1 Tax=Asticcacaulis sp. AC402 TaxID=1282361 RepID=UPI0003C3DEF3|nr:AsmA-like C-terminal region-containing protein [Asticcacaulis sp. AC402]ESQ76438.1 hypothetical protein ABAC402_04880 [Asticcacaulis sp. AC402]
MLPQPVKKIFDILHKRPRLFVFGWLLVMLTVFAWRLAQGPIRVDGIRPVIVSRIETALPGTHAAIKHLDLVWFGDARAVGFRFEDVDIRDTSNRTIFRAARMETALAADSLILAHLAPARLTASDVVLVASVSKDGRYELGFDARGKPGQGPAGLDRFFYDLTGQEKLGRPISFARQISVRNGHLRLIQEGSGLDWTAKITAIDFSKLRGRLQARADLSIGGADSRASFQAQANGLVGLKQASISANLKHLVPARVFPSVGITRHLSSIDAPVNGLARIDYGVAKGFEGAWVDLDAGAGHVKFGGNRQVFDSARIRASYASSDRTALFQTFQLRSHLLDTDLSGKVIIEPADLKNKRDLRITFDFSGPRLTGRLADDFSRQTLTDAHFKGAYIPRQRRLEIETGKGSLNGAPFESQGVVYTDDKGRLGADLTARIDGHFTKDEVFAFWPEDLSPGTRSELIKRIQGGDYANADFVLKAPPGHFERDQLQDEDLRLDFDFDDLGLMIEERMAHATGLRGHGTLRGNSFMMNVDGGRLVDVVLTKGALRVPDFHDQATQTTIWLEAQGSAVDIIEAVDPLADGSLAGAGLTRERMRGQATVRIDIAFPTFGVTDDNFDLRFDGKIADAALTQAALGWDLSDGDLTVSGDLMADRIVVSGQAKVGPYAGDIAYSTHFDDPGAAVDFTGSFNAAQFGGSPRVPVAITGHFAMSGGKGEGTVDADIFRGNVTWEGDELETEHGRPSHVVIEGVTLGTGMEAQGLPVFELLKRELPTRISLLRSGDIWAGEVDAEALSGDIAYIEGERPRLVYKSIITPDEARELGYGGLPVFNESRHLTVNVALDDQSKEALVKLDDINAVLGWSEVEGKDQLLRRLRMTVRPEDWETLGLPVAFFTPIRPIDVTALWQQTGGHLRGEVRLLGEVVDFEMFSQDARAIDDPYGLRVQGHVTDEVLRVLGYSHDPLEVAGDATFVFSLYETQGHPAAVVNVDAMGAALSVKATDWDKPVGEAARFSISMDDKGVGQAGVNLSRIVGAGDQIRIDGRASFDSEGKLEFADFSDLYLRDFIDVRYKYFASDASDVISITGRQLDLRPWLKGADKDGKPMAGSVPARGVTRTVDVRPVHIVVDLDQVKMSSEGAFSGLAADLTWDGRSGMTGEGRAVTADGKPVTLAMESQGAYSLFSIVTEDLGSVIRTASGGRNVWGGEAVIEGAYMAGQIDATLRGEDIRVKQIPVMAQLLTVASLQGVADTLTGEGIAFSDFEFPIRYRDHTLFIDDGWAEGEAMGFSLRGTTNFEAKTMDFRGTLIPAYRVNAIFGDLGSNGLGLLGLKYGLAGTYKAPTPMVDPLSVIMPGFIKVWERDQIKTDPITALDLPSLKGRLAQIREENEARSKN